MVCTVPETEIYCSSVQKYRADVPLQSPPDERRYPNGAKALRKAAVIDIRPFDRVIRAYACLVHTKFVAIYLYICTQYIRIFTNSNSHIVFHDANQKRLERFLIATTIHAHFEPYESGVAPMPSMFPRLSRFPEPRTTPKRIVQSISSPD